MKEFFSPPVSHANMLAVVCSSKDFSYTVVKQCVSQTNQKGRMLETHPGFINTFNNSNHLIMLSFEA